MQPTGFQPAQLYGSNGELIRDGAYGQETSFVDDHGTGWSDYVNNNLEYLNMVATGELVPVTALPASGVRNKKYIITTGTDAGKIYYWTGTAWIETYDAVSRSEAAAQRAETSQNAAEENAQTAATAAQTAGTAATTATTKAGEASSSASAAAESERKAKEYADEIMEYTPEGYTNLAEIIRGLAGLRLVWNHEDGGIDAYY